MSTNIIQDETPLKKPALWVREPLPYVKKVIAVASGKGGVGKSTTTVGLATSLTQAGKRVGILDADMYGPSIPHLMGLSGQPEFKEQMIPLEASGIVCNSIGFIIGDSPAVLRGPMITKTLNQLLRMTRWGTKDAPLDILLIDMPPGTGDIHLSIAQQVPLTGAIIVTTPQEVALIDARKCAHMFMKVHVPVLGVIENMSGSIFGSGGGAKMAQDFNVPLLGTIAMREEICRAGELRKPSIFPDYATIAMHAALN
jgi:ATP-binding protein involved in chromosome partitioning